MSGLLIKALDRSGFRARTTRRATPPATELATAAGARIRPLNGGEHCFGCPKSLQKQASSHINVLTSTVVHCSVSTEVFSRKLVLTGKARTQETCQAATL